MEMSYMDISSSVVRDIPVLRLNRQLTKKNYNDLPTYVADFFVQGHAGVVMDLEPVDFIDSTGISILLTCKKKADAARRSFALCRASSYLADVIDKLNLKTVFMVAKSVEDAVDACAGQS